MENSPQVSERRKGFLEEPIDGQVFKSLAESALTWLRTNSQIVNALNVFPVPDGDTGTNMVLTMQAAFDEIADSPERHLGKMAHELAQGALMGARGNSGVILSQLWRGFARALDHHAVLSSQALVEALTEARDTAYRGVVRPVEGTILTVSKDMAMAAVNLNSEEMDVVSLLDAVVDAADASVARTPELLPVLKDAGVVDSGGKGLYFLFDGMRRYIDGRSLEEAEAAVQPLSAMNLEASMLEVEEGQDYEVIVDFRPAGVLDLKKFYSDLEEMGTSIQVGEGDGMYRMHIHVPTENRYLPIDYTMGIGTITKVHIENLMAQMEEIEAKSKSRLNLASIDPDQIGLVTVSPGAGISRVFASLGVNAIVEGGQTMNPSTQEILNAFENFPTNHVVILPNNKNIILAAQAASELTVKKVAVIPSRTIPQGLSAMLSFDPEGDFETVVENMSESIHDVETGEITTATRSVEIDGVGCREGETIVLHNGKLILASPTLNEAVMNFLEHIEADEYEILTMFYGDSINVGDANQVADQIREAYPDLEVEIQEGGQPHYQFIFSVE
jgi:DAK2 domain fusion protein YloV